MRAPSVDRCAEQFVGLPGGPAQPLALGGVAAHHPDDGQLGQRPVAELSLGAGVEGVVDPAEQPGGPPEAAGHAVDAGAVVAQCLVDVHAAVAAQQWPHLLGRIDDALDSRPKGKLRHRALAQLPVVGVVGGYAAEREALRRAARRADEVLSAPVR